VSTDPRRSTIVAIIAVFALFGAGVVISARMLTGGRLLPRGARIAIVPLRGTIEDEGPFLRTLESFASYGGVRGFVIEIESPGGVVGASQSIYEGIRRLRDRDNRPVIAWIGDVGASGAYYAAMGADSVFALPGSVTGSIGVVMEFPVAEELLEKVGVRWEVVKSGEYKDAGSPARALTEADRAVLSALVEDMHEQFVDAVAERRPLTRSEVQSLSDGRVFTGRQALELGLVDGVGTLQDAIAVAGRMAGLGDRPRTQRPAERRRSLWEVLLGRSTAEARGLLTTLVSTHSGTPRLLYEWK